MRKEMTLRTLHYDKEDEFEKNTHNYTLENIAETFRVTSHIPEHVYVQNIQLTTFH